MGGEDLGRVEPTKNPRLCRVNWLFELDDKVGIQCYRLEVPQIRLAEA